MKLLADVNMKVDFLVLLSVVLNKLICCAFFELTFFISLFLSENGRSYGYSSLV